MEQWRAGLLKPFDTLLLQPEDEMWKVYLEGSVSSFLISQTGPNTLSFGISAGWARCAKKSMLSVGARYWRKKHSGLNVYIFSSNLLEIDPGGPH